MDKSGNYRNAMLVLCLVIIRLWKLLSQDTTETENSASVRWTFKLKHKYKEMLLKLKSSGRVIKPQASGFKQITSYRC